MLGVFVALVIGVLVGYVGGVRRGKLNTSPETRALAEHVETFREVVKATEGYVPQQVEKALQRMLNSPLAEPDCWDTFFEDFRVERNGRNSVELLKQWARRIRWDPKRRALVVNCFKTEDRPLVRKIIDDVWSGIPSTASIQNPLDNS